MLLCATLFREIKHFAEIERHLQEFAARRQRLGAVEHPDVVQTEESPSEDVLPVGILAIHPPGKIQGRQTINYCHTALIHVCVMCVLLF